MGLFTKSKTDITVTKDYQIPRCKSGEGGEKKRKDMCKSM